MSLIPRKKRLVLFYFLFIGTLAFQLVTKNDLKRDFQQVTPFINDTNIPFRIERSVSHDYDTTTVLLTRLFHNKITALGETMFISLGQSLDPVYLFSIPAQPYPEDNVDRPQLLYPVELPLFIIFSIVLIRSNAKKIKRYLITALFLSLLLDILLLPYTNVIKIIPLLIIIRTVTFLGFVEFFKKTTWFKKLF